MRMKSYIIKVLFLPFFLPCFHTLAIETYDFNFEGKDYKFHFFTPLSDKHHKTNQDVINFCSELPSKNEYLWEYPNRKLMKALGRRHEYKGEGMFVKNPITKKKIVGSILTYDVSRNAFYVRHSVTRRVHRVTNIENMQVSTILPVCFLSDNMSSTKKKNETLHASQKFMFAGLGLGSKTPMSLIEKSELLNEHSFGSNLYCSALSRDYAFKQHGIQGSNLYREIIKGINHINSQVGELTNYYKIHPENKMITINGSKEQNVESVFYRTYEGIIIDLSVKKLYQGINAQVLKNSVIKKYGKPQSVSEPKRNRVLLKWNKAAIKRDQNKSVRISNIDNLRKHFNVIPFYEHNDKIRDRRSSHTKIDEFNEPLMIASIRDGFIVYNLIDVKSLIDILEKEAKRCSLAINELIDQKMKDDSKLINLN